MFFYKECKIMRETKKFYYTWMELSPKNVLIFKRLHFFLPLKNWTSEECLPTPLPCPKLSKFRNVLNEQPLTHFAILIHYKALLLTLKMTIIFSFNICWVFEFKKIIWHSMFCSHEIFETSQSFHNYIWLFWRRCKFQNLI